MWSNSVCSETRIVRHKSDHFRSPALVVSGGWTSHSGG